MENSPIGQGRETVEKYRPKRCGRFWFNVLSPYL